MAAYQDRQLSTPTVIINDVIIPIMPNSLKTDIPIEGKVTPTSAGGAAVDIVVGVDTASMKGKVQFDIAATAQNRDRVKAWKQLLLDSIGSSILVVDQGSQEAYVKMYLVNHVELTHTADGKIPLHWEGAFLN